MLSIDQPLKRTVTLSWSQGVSRYQWLVLFVAWLGWVFDSMDATIYALVLHPALEDLLHVSQAGASTETIGWYGGIIFSVFLIGWAIGGVLFGILADRFGRTKTLIATILIYAVFTGMAALAEEWWHLAIYRFLTALGIGGEWAAGAAIVAETWPEDKRATAAGILQSAWAVGFFLAALLNLLFQGYGWRMLFLIGILPAFAALLVRAWVKEPERWQHTHAQECAPGARRDMKLVELFRDYPRATWVGSGLAFVAVFGLWGVTSWTPESRARPPRSAGSLAWRYRRLHQLRDHGCERRRLTRLPEFWTVGRSYRKTTGLCTDVRRESCAGPHHVLYAA